MPSRLYQRCFNSIRRKNRLTFTYDGEPREVCPHVLGHSEGEEKLFAYQVAGRTSKGPVPPRGKWKCLFLSKIQNLKSKAGPWKTGSSHKRPHSCVKEVDIDVNPEAKQKFSWQEHLHKQKLPEKNMLMAKSAAPRKKRKHGTRGRSAKTATGR